MGSAAAETVTVAARFEDELILSMLVHQRARLDAPIAAGTEHIVMAWPIALVHQRARLDAPIAAGTEHIVMAWPIALDGRKRLAGGAVVSAAGETLAVAGALLIEPRS